MPSVSVGLVFCIDEGKKGGRFILNQQLNLLQQAEIYTHKKKRKQLGTARLCCRYVIGSESAVQSPSRNQGRCICWMRQQI